MSTLDQTIQALFTKLAERKAKVAALKTEIAKSWKTTGVFRLIGATSTTNIQTASVEVIEECAFHLGMYDAVRATVTTRLGREVWPKVHGYHVDDWYSDLKKRLAMIDVREEERQLEALEQRLNGVLSPEERRRIEVEMLAKELE